MNLFEFFHAAAYRYLGRNHLSAQEQSDLPARIRQLNRGFGGSAPIDYSDPLTRLAYIFSYAPKHAIIWREYMRRPPQNVATGSFSLNSLGTACGPEIIGVLEGMAWNQPGVVTVHCHDTEPGWDPLLCAVVAEYCSRRGSVLQVQVGALARSTYTLGSLVLSEVVKQGAQRTFRSSMTQAIGPAEGLFLDITNCRLPDGTEPYLSDVFGFGFFNFTREGLKVKDVVNNEMNSCPNCQCMIPLGSEPKMNYYFTKFK